MRSIFVAMVAAAACGKQSSERPRGTRQRGARQREACPGRRRRAHADHVWRLRRRVRSFSGPRPLPLRGSLDDDPPPPRRKRTCRMTARPSPEEPARRWRSRKPRWAASPASTTMRDQALTRQQAIDQARKAGILGTVAKRDERDEVGAALQRAAGCRDEPRDRGSFVRQARRRPYRPRQPRSAHTPAGLR